MLGSVTLARVLIVGSIELCVYIFFFFFFQAEDGIRDHCVTGVQTCALPILGLDGLRELGIPNPPKPNRLD